MTTEDTTTAPGSNGSDSGTAPATADSGTAPATADSGTAPATAAYLDQVRREIDDEVRRRRAAGEFPASFERSLDELFARFTPTGASDDRFVEAMQLADRAAYFDTAAPIGSRRTAKGFARWALWQAEAWFVNYVVSQLNHFAAASTRVAHLLDERVEDLERDMALLAPPPVPGTVTATAGPDPAPFLQALLQRMTAPGTPTGRVLHAECGNGSVLDVLVGVGIDAYGIDPGSLALDDAARRGLDVRRDDVLGHLTSVRAEALAGVVLSGCVDRMSLAERRRLIDLVEPAVAPGGTVVVLGTAPAHWDVAVGPVVADLAPGRPLHPETWRQLLEAAGLSDIEVVQGPPGGEPWPEPAAGDRAMATLIARLEPLLGGPASFAVLATRPAGGGDRRASAGSSRAGERAGS
ncbi:MAG: hypothetical protein M0Z63_05840 [Actinomycetota bacterium]|nr:hypothetical protein [Actinomycetota bacterium]